MRLDVVLASTLLEHQPLREHVCAVIDVLRATTTAITALAAGAIEVRSCLNIMEARKGAQSPQEQSCLLGGEEKGERIPGFHLGNSPLEYLATDIVEGKVIYFYTTNGTGAIRRAYEECGHPVYIAALVNLSAVSSAMAKTACGSAKGIAIVCSGRYGGPSAEDLLCAGLMVDRICHALQGCGIAPELSDGATIAAAFAAGNRGHSLQVLASSEHGRFLQSIGFADDLVFASRIDLYDIVPVFDGERIAPLHDEP